MISTRHAGLALVLTCVTLGAASDAEGQTPTAGMTDTPVPSDTAVPSPDGAELGSSDEALRRLAFPELDVDPRYDARVLDLVADEAARLQSWEQSLEERERQLKVLESAVVARIDELVAIQKALEQGLVTVEQQIEEADKQRLDKLVKTVGGMKPKKAAATLDTMDETLATKVLMAMNPRQSGKIMNELKPNKAATLGTKFTERRLGKK